MNSPNAQLVVGPILHARGAGTEHVQLSAVVVIAAADRTPVLVPEDGRAVEPRELASLYGHRVVGYDFALPVRQGASYSLDGAEFAVATDLTGDVRIAFVSCNGQENGDDMRDADARNVMWRRLEAEHLRRPFSLLLQGGDQLYADEVVDAHPELLRWSEAPPRKCARIAFTGEMYAAARRYFFSRYVSIMGAGTAAAPLMATVPSMMIWDDHDIVDGWGSHPREFQESDVGRGLFAIAREMFILFQLGARPDSLPPTCLDQSGTSLGTAARFPGFSVLLPDLRSEREPTRVMGPNGWRVVEEALAEAPAGDRRLIVSSVPALGPRLSLIERILDFFPKMQKYEDDLRDQWQSRGHREEWCCFLRACEAQVIARDSPLTILSGEIHLATRAEMALQDGRVLHQLVASGIAHPRPHRAYALGLGALSRAGDAPLPGRPIRIRPLPGRRLPYAAERNYLVLDRKGGRWQAEWELETSGRTAPLFI